MNRLFPTPAQAEAQPLLPDPFHRQDGTRVKIPNQWPDQREHLLAMVDHYLYGACPPAPSALSVQDGGAAVHLHWQGEAADCDMTYTLTLPEGPGPHPVLVACHPEPGLSRWLREVGWGLAALDEAQLAPDSPRYQEGLCGRAYPGYTWRALRMWAWGMSRVADSLAARSDIDAQRMVAAGFSRYGKAALCAAVHDTRFAACIAASSGCGGAGLFRVIGDRYGIRRPEAETLGSMTRPERYFYWLSDEVAAFGNQTQDFALGQEAKLPFDTHFLHALIAPRPLMILGALDDGLWGNPLGTAVAWRAGAEVYRFLGAPEHLGLHFREGGHAFTAEDWAPMVDFLNVTLWGRAPTHCWKTLGDPSDANWADPLQYADWTAPTPPVLEPSCL